MARARFDDSTPSSCIGRGRSRRSARARGFTLIELLTGLTIVAIIASVSIPSFQDFRLRQRLKGVATNLFTDLQYARSEAVQRNGRLAVSFAVGANWCYGIHEGAAPCNCAIAPGSCSIKTVQSTDYPGVTMSSAQFNSSNGTAAWYAIDPRRAQSVNALGNPVAGSIVFTAAGAGTLRGDLNAVGRLRVCAPSGNTHGFPAC